MGNKRILGAALAAAGLIAAGSASAIVVTPDDDPNNLVNALLGGGGAGIDLTTVTVTVMGQASAPGTPPALSTGTYTNASNTYGIGDGILISSGSVADYGDGPNTSDSQTTGYGPGGGGVPALPAQEALLDPITGGGFDHFDVTQIDIGFDMLPGATDVFFNVTFGSEEFPEYVGSDFIDGFGLFVNGVNIADVAGLPVNINHPAMLAAPGTELDGILGGSQGAFGALVHTFTAPVNATGNSLTFIVADTSDAILDTTAYISQLGGSPPPPPQVPVPAPLALLGLGLVALAARQRK